MKVGGDIPSKEVLGFGKVTLGGEFVAAEGVGVRDGLVWRNGAPDEEGCEGGGGFCIAGDCVGVKGDRGLVVNEAVGRGEGGGGNSNRKGLGGGVTTRR